MSIASRSPRLRRLLQTVALLLACTGIAVGQPAPATRPSAFAAEIVERRYPNGIRAVVAKTPPVPGRAPRVFIGLYLRYGAPAAPGRELAHLVEHVVANNLPEVVDYQLPGAMVTFGSNAMTRADYMSFWRTVSPDGLEPMLRNRANRVDGVRNDSAVFVREVGRVASETQRAIDRVTARGLDGGDVLPIAFFGVAPAREVILDSIRGYRPETVFREIDRFLRPDNALVVVAGDLDPRATLALLDRDLPRHPKRSGPTARRGPGFVRYREPVVVSDPRVTAVRVGLGLPAPERTGPDYLAWLVLDQLLLGGRVPITDSSAITRSIDSPLGRRLRDGLGVTAIDDGRFERTDPPLLALRSPSYLPVYFEVPERRPVAEVTRATLAALERSLTEDFGDDAVERAKREVIEYLDGLMLGPDLLPLADHLAGFALIDGSAGRLNRLAEELRSVTPARVRRLSKWYLPRGRVRLAIVTPSG